MLVPNTFPTRSAPYRIALIGEAPGKDEEALGKPFVGASGRLLNGLLAQVKILREACFVGNVCQLRPPDNMLAAFDWDGDEIQQGIFQLIDDLNAFKPHLCVLLGGTALHLFKAGNVPVKKGKDKKGLKFRFPNSIESWRGSLFESVELSNPLSNPPMRWKCLPTYHPAFCLRAYENVPILAMDLARAFREGTSPTLSFPKRDLIIPTTLSDMLRLLDSVVPGMTISLDIEGNYLVMPCISISTHPSTAFIVPFSLISGQPCWLPPEEALITRRLATILADPRILKVWQNGLYDRWNLQYGHSMPVYGNHDDTMLKWWEKYCELPKSLATQTSILTEEPFYKADRKSTDDTTYFQYCCKDSAVTLEINQKLDPLLAAHSPRAVEHYRFNHTLLNLFLYIELRGINYDTPLAATLLEEVEDWINRTQCKLDELAGVGLSSDTTLLEVKLREVACYKKDGVTVKAPFADDFPKALSLCQKDSITEADRGWLAAYLGLGMNIRSPQFKEFLYSPRPTGLGLPEQYGKEGQVTTDSLAMLKLSKKHPHPALDAAIQIGFLRTRSQMLHISADPDGRIRSSYNIVGTVTGRITSSTSPTGSGYNLQTLPKKDTLYPEGHPLRRGMRELVLADPGHYLFECDLKGSDGWTIGAHLKRLGDPTMLNDLRAGIKPAARIAYMVRHGITSLRDKSLEETKELLKEVKGDDPDYHALKIGIWGMCYLMGPDLLADEIYENTDGKVLMSRTQIIEFRDVVMRGYSLKLWHDWMKRQLAQKPQLISASGHCRRFYNRPDDALAEALANEPQENTTYATNLAAYRLWMDPDNRTDRWFFDKRSAVQRVPFFIEPLHQVHDALIGQFPIERTEWAIDKIKSYFNNPLVIAGETITIPFEGHFGPSWGDQSKGNI